MSRDQCRTKYPFLYEAWTGAEGQVRQLQGLLHDRFRIRLKQKSVSPDTKEEEFDGIFDWATEWAVREFQIYAAAPRALSSDLKTSVSKTDADIYKGRVTGAVDHELVDVMRLWCERGWVCPVIVSAYNIEKKVPDEAAPNGKRLRNEDDDLTDKDKLVAENVWRYDELKRTEPRFFVQDFSGLFTEAVGVLLGKPQDDAQRWLEKPRPLGSWTGGMKTGPYSSGLEAWSRAEALPERLLDRSDLEGSRIKSPVLASAFKVIRAVFDVECWGFLDVINHYDGGVLSVPGFHWTLTDEMAGFLAFARRHVPDAYSQGFERFGFGTGLEWLDDAKLPAFDTGSGESLQVGGQAKYGGKVLLHAAAKGGSAVTRTVTTTDYPFLRSWHVAYRLAMVCRALPAVQHAVWRFALLRLRDMLGCRFPAGHKYAGKQLGEVVQSEKAIATLLRIHVNKPARVICNREVATDKDHAVGRIIADLETKNFSDREKARKWEEDLVGKLKENASKLLGRHAKTIPEVADWPQWYDKPRETRPNHSPRYAISDAHLPDGVTLRLTSDASDGLWNYVSRTGTLPPHPYDPAAFSAPAARRVGIGGTRSDNTLSDALACREFLVACRLTDSDAYPPNLAIHDNAKLRKTRVLLADWILRGRRPPIQYSALQPAAPSEARSDVWRLPGATKAQPFVQAAGTSKYFPVPGDVDFVGRFDPEAKRFLADNNCEDDAPAYRCCDASAEFTPVNFLPQPPGGAAHSQLSLSTFRILRAVAEGSFGAFADSLRTELDAQGAIKAWQCCFWRDLEPNASGRVGPASGLLAFFASHPRESVAGDFRKYFRDLGLTVQPKPNGLVRLESDHAQRQFLSCLSVTTAPNGDPVGETGRGDAAWEVLATWQWFHRIQLAFRSSRPLREAVWDLARAQLAFLLEAPWPDSLRLTTGGAGRVLLAHAFRSERSMAGLLAAHLANSNAIVSKGVVATALRKAVAGLISAKALSREVTTWTDEHEAQVLDACAAVLDPKSREALKAATTWTLDPASRAYRCWGYRLRPGDVDDKRDLGRTRAPLQRLPLDGLIDLTGIPDMVRPGGGELPARYLMFENVASAIRPGLLVRATETAASSAQSRRLQNTSAGEKLQSVEVVSIVFGSGANAIVLPMPGGVTLAYRPSEKTEAIRVRSAPDEPMTEVQAERIDASSLSDAGGKAFQSIDLTAQTELWLPADQPVRASVTLSLRDLQTKPAFHITATLTAPFLRSPIRIDRQISQLEASLQANAIVFDNLIDTRLLNACCPFALEAEQGFSSRLAIGADADARGDLTPYLDFSASIGNMSIPLGGPWATLFVQAEPAATVSFGTRAGLAFQAPALRQLRLRLHLVVPDDLLQPTRFLSEAADVPASAGQPLEIDLLGATEPAAARRRAVSGRIAAERSSAYTAITWDEEGNLSLLAEPLLGKEFRCEDRQFDLSRFGGEALAGAGALQLKLGLKGNASISADGVFRLPTVDVVAGLRGGPGLQANAQIGGRLRTRDAGRYLDLSGIPFFFEPELPMTFGKHTLQIGSVATLDVLQPVTAKLRLGEAPSLRFAEVAGKVRLTLPGDSSSGKSPLRFAFDLQDLAFEPGGISLKGTVRAQALGPGTGAQDADGWPFAAPLEVEPADPSRPQPERMGEIEIRSGRLVHGALRARTRLRFFDDANAILALRFFQDENNRIRAGGTVEIPANREFQVRALMLSFTLRRLVFSLTYDGSDWAASGHISGTLVFKAAAGRRGESIGPFSRLFDGVRVTIEELDIVNVGFREVGVDLPPVTFEVGEILRVTLNGFDILRTEARRGVRLRGDLELLKLPGLDSELRLGGITLEERPGSWLPRIRFDRIGALLSLQNEIRMKGVFEQFDSDEEVGFGGEFSLESPALPKFDALVKLTRVRAKNGDAIPSLVVYVDTDRSDPLGYGFYVRRFGVGFGLYQGLGKLGEERDQLTMAQRIQKFVDGPRGLPNPGSLSSWEPTPPARAGDQLRWVLVGSGQISFGLLPTDRDHLMVGALIVALDERFDVLAGVNVWFFASPNDARSDAFYAAPALRGALGLSPREGRLYGRFRTLPNSKMGKSAPDLLKQALNAIQASVTIYADRNGTLLEVGWPWELVGAYSQGPFSGRLTGGYRYGLYRGTLGFGFNFSMDVQLRAEARFALGFAGLTASVGFSAHARALFVTQFSGALTDGFRPYLVGSVRVACTLSASVSCYLSVRNKIGFLEFNLVLIDFSVTISLAIDAMLEAALTPAGIGFRGSVNVAFRVAGFSIGGVLPISSDPDRVDEARRVIDQLLPPISELVRPPAQARAAGKKPRSAAVRGMFRGTARTVEKTAAVHWHYRARRVNGELRVLLFPAPGHRYAGIVDQAPPGDRTNRVVFDEGFLKRFEFVGFLGSSARPTEDGTGLEWSEALDQTLMSRAEVIRRSASQLSGEELAAIEDLRVVDVLRSLDAGPGSSEEELVVEEIVDPRVANPVAGDFDDIAPSLVPGRYSTRFRLRRGAGVTLSLFTYDDHLLACTQTRATQTPGAAQGPGKSRDHGPTTGTLLLEALEMLGSSELAPGRPMPTPRVTPHLNLILVFREKEKQTLDGSEEPLVPQRIFADNGESATMLGQSAVIERAEPRSKGFTYALTPGHTFQSNGEIGLTWELSRWMSEDPTEVAQGYEAHEGVERYRVTRIPSQGVKIASRTFEFRPTWYRHGDPEDPAKTYLVRPRFQFLDPELPKPEAERDIAGVVEYVVEALDEEGSVVTQTRFRVHYRPIVPWPSVNQATALWILGGRATPGRTATRRLLLRTATAIPAAQVSGSREQWIAKHLKVRAYAVEAGRAGAYARSRHVEAELMSPEERAAKSGQAAAAMLDAAPMAGSGLELELPVISEPHQRRSLSWWETRPVSFKVASTIREVKVPAGDASGASTSTLLYCELELDDRAFPQQPGAAVEYYVGLWGSDGEPDDLQVDPRVAFEFSTLFKCRHAISTLDSSQSPTETGVLDPGAFAALMQSGNDVVAFEAMPKAPRLKRESIDPKRMDLSAEYPPLREASGTADAEPRPPSVRIDFPHADAGTISDYGPVCGYRVWWRDEYAAPAAEATWRTHVVSVVSERAFRAFPAVVRPVLEKRASGQPVTDWSPVSGHGRRALLAPWPKSDALPSLAMPNFAPVPSPLGDVLIHQDLHGCVIPGHEEADRRWVMTHPLAALSAASLEGTPEVSQRVQALIEGLDAIKDPYGWFSLERLGLSAALRLDGEQDRYAPEAWIDGAGVSNPRLRFVTCRRYPGAPMLYSVRVVHGAARDLVRPGGRDSTGTWDARFGDDALGPVLSLLLFGFVAGARPPSLFEDDTATPNGKRLRLDDGAAQRLVDWLDDLHKRLSDRLVGDVEASGRIMELVPTEYLGRPPAIPEEVPVVDGRIGLTIPMTDLLGHRIAVSIDTIRRYDELLSDADQQRESPVPPTGASVAHAQVDRTRSISSPVLIAAPSPGGLAVTTYAHPAAAASMASAPSAAMLQYQGEYYAYERRLNPEYRSRLVTWMTKTTIGEAGSPIDLPLFAAASAISADDDAEQVLPSLTELQESLARCKVEPVYGADTFVLALPPPYEWRVSGFVAAGRAVSSWARSVWLYPMFAPGDREAIDDSDMVLVPRAPVPRASLEGDVLTVSFPLATASSHLGPVLWTLWAASDERIDVNRPGGGRALLRVSDMPDLKTRYLVWVEMPTSAEPVRLPLVKAAPAEQAGIDVELMDDSLGLHRFSIEQPQEDRDGGKLFLKIEISLEDARWDAVREYLQGLVAGEGNVASAILVVAERDGMWSTPGRGA